MPKLSVVFNDYFYTVHTIEQVELEQSTAGKLNFFFW